MDKDKRYNKKRQIKTVSFLKEEHKEILEYANSLDDFSGHVRRLLERELEAHKRVTRKEMEAKNDNK